VASALYLLSTEADSGKSALALALFDALARRVARPAVFRPVTRDGADDFIVDLLLSRLPEGSRPKPQDCVGVTYEDRHHDEAGSRGAIVDRFRVLTHDHDGILVVGSDFTDVGSATEFAINMSIALDLGTPVATIISGRRPAGGAAGNRDAGEIAAATEHALETLAAARLPVVAVVANRVQPEAVRDVRHHVTRAVRRHLDDVTVAVVPDLPLLSAPTLRQIAAATRARVLRGREADLGRVAAHQVIAAMTLPHMLDHLREEALVIFPGDRSDVLVGTLAAARAETFPTPSGIVLTGGFEPEPTTRRLVDGFPPTLPILLTEMPTFEVATTVAGLRGRMRAGSTRKIDAALSHAATWFPAEEILDRISLQPTTAVTPLMFTHDVVERARDDRRHIVLPEGTEPRVLAAAERVLRRGIANLTLLGQPGAVAQAAAEAGVDVTAARVVDPVHDPLRERFADVYAELRRHKGVTRDQAWDVVTDVSYFGTLLVHLGLADGMVSGAVHTTAHTIRPAFEIIRTVPGVDVVSSVFFMLLPDRVLVYGDCAVVPDPTTEQLADIAVSSAATARAFGVDPRVALLSYSTGESGAGAEVEKVRAATALVRERAPDLPVDGPLQYDAAVDPGVGRTKAPASPVAGQATVLVFPDLNTGNNTYKAVQRSAGATAVGPVLQGLNKPVNDLSRGATVDDIALTIAVTAVQAQQATEHP
jgi:phosphate acetyltransferase